MKNKVKKSGGKRAGAGCPLKYGEQMKAVNLYLPISKIDDFKELVKYNLKQFEAKTTTNQPI